MTLQDRAALDRPHQRQARRRRAGQLAHACRRDRQPRARARRGAGARARRRAGARQLRGAAGRSRASTPSTSPCPTRCTTSGRCRRIAAGKHVLCEKPYSRSPGDVQEAFAAAEAAGVVLAEAFMWRHHPQALRLDRAGRRRRDRRAALVRAAFSFPLDDPRDVRLLEELAGGGLMDVGCYCISAARMLAGEPASVTAQQLLTPSGVDRRLVATLAHEGDVLTHFDCALDLPDRSELEAVGSEGSPARERSLAQHRDGHRARGRRRRPRALRDPGRPTRTRCELDDLAGAVAGEHPPRLGLADALGQARTIDAVLRAAAERPARRRDRFVGERAAKRTRAELAPQQLVVEAAQRGRSSSERRSGRRPRRRPPADAGARAAAPRARGSPPPRARARAPSAEGASAGARAGRVSASRASRSSERAADAHARGERRRRARRCDRSRTSRCATCERDGERDARPRPPRRP